MHRLLLTPGPTPVPPEVAAACARPLPHHRSPEFTALFERVLERLKAVYRTTSDVLVFASSGTAAVESAFQNLVEPGDPILVVTCGNFGDRWVTMAGAYGAAVEVLRYPEGERPSAAEVSARINGRDDLVAAFVVHSETSTGSVLDLEAVATGTRGRSALLVVDAISSLGAAPLETDAWGIDVVVTGSQKALRCPPGLAFVSVSERALARSAVTTGPRFAFDWQRTVAAHRMGTSPFTPAISLLCGLDVALAQIEAIGPDVLHARTRSMGAGLRAAAHALGLELLSPDDPACSLVTAIRWPEGIDGEAVRGAMRDRHGVSVAGGQGALKGRIVRFGAFGAIEPGDLVQGVAALELELAAAGFPVAFGAGVGAFLEACA